MLSFYERIVKEEQLYPGTTIHSVLEIAQDYIAEMIIKRESVGDISIVKKLDKIWNSVEKTLEVIQKTGMQL
jgi:hypothetical protein